MATAIETYSAAKNEFAHCASWASLIGSSYRGGGGGTGKLTSLSLNSGELSPTIYHQYSDGAKNYHLMPAALKPHLEAAIKQQIGALLADALARQKAALQALADRAVKEHAAMLLDAGLTT